MSSADNPVMRSSLRMTAGQTRLKVILGQIGQAFLFLVTFISVLAVLFIFYFIAKDAVPFFRTSDLGEFFGSTRWYPSREPAEFGALSLFFGSGLVTLGATVVAVPMGVAAAVCLSDILPFWLRQWMKPVIEILASIPSVAYGFFALVVFAPQLQERGGILMAVAVWLVGLPLLGLLAVVVSDLLSERFGGEEKSGGLRTVLFLVVAAPGLAGLYFVGSGLSAIDIGSGTNALNASIILGIMALPTVVSVSEDALQAVGLEIRQGSYGLGATRAETLLKAVLPAASSGILAAVVLGIMRAIGETMVVWMASGNAAQIPQPWYDVLAPVRTLTATIAGDMGEADHTTGSMRYSVLFALALCLLVFCFVCNVVSEWVVKRSRRKLRGED